MLSDKSDNVGFFYSGRSMKSTFRDGDYLRIEPVNFDALQPGDVVVFKKTENSKPGDLFVHRVITINNRDLTTRGDDNLFNDNPWLSADNLLGRVVSCDRCGRSVRIIQGRLGLARAKGIRLRIITVKKIISILRPLYLLLKKSRLVPAVWRPDLKKIVLCSPHGEKIKYIHRGKTVFIHCGDRVLFKKRPYDLFF